MSFPQYSHSFNKKRKNTTASFGDKRDETASQHHYKTECQFICSYKPRNNKLCGLKIKLLHSEGHKRTKSNEEILS